MNVRQATDADLRSFRALRQELGEEPPASDGVRLPLEERGAGGELALVAEEQGTIVGMIVARGADRARARITDLYVAADSRGGGVGSALLRALGDLVAGEGVEALVLEVPASSATAREVGARLGFQEELVTLVAPLDELERRLGQRKTGRSFGSIHVQTDDAGAIARAVEIYVPRLPGRSRGSVVTEPRGGYVSVFDDASDRDPAVLRRLAREISSRTGLVTIVLGIEHEALLRLIVLDRGSIVDEYASVPEFHGPLPPGEVVALQANPVVIERLTGADRESVRAATPMGATPQDLSPPADLLERLALVLGIEDASHRWESARELPGAVRLDR